MKKILTLLLIIISVNSFAQVDGKTKLSVTLAAKDCEYIVKYFEKTNKYEDIDSVLKKKWRVASPPTNNASVIIDSVQGNVLFDIWNKLSVDNVATSDTAKVHKRFSDACRETTGANGSWLRDKITNSGLKQFVKEQDDTRANGVLYLIKQQPVN